MPRVKSPSGAPEEPLCPSLPPEIWINIFSHCHDLSHLWNTCRRVSPTLKACAERAFGAFHLKHVQVEFQLDKWNLGGKRGPHEPAITLEFERLGKGEEESVAWFSGHFRGHKAVKGAKNDKTEEVIMKRWLENVKNRKPELPNYTISVGSMVNDTHIPGLIVGSEGYNARLEWREMLELFFREQARLEELKAAWQGRRSPDRDARLAKKSKTTSVECVSSSWQDAAADVRPRGRCGAVS